MLRFDVPRTQGFSDVPFVQIRLKLMRWFILKIIPISRFTVLDNYLRIELSQQINFKQYTKVFRKTPENVLFLLLFNLTKYHPFYRDGHQIVAKKLNGRFVVEIGRL